MITIERLSKRLGGRPVLADVSLEIQRGEVVALVGPSGTGKSVLLKHIIGLLHPDAGDVRINGKSIPRASFHRLTQVRLQLGYVFQDAALLDWLTVGENLRLALPDHLCRGDDNYAPTRINRALARVNLDAQVIDRFPNELSGGMRKRVGVARAIIHDPHVILYDEPTTGLDPRNVLAINELILSNRAHLGATSVVITHDLASIRQLADRVALLSGGRLVFYGEPDDFFASADSTVRNFIGPLSKEQS